MSWQAYVDSSLVGSGHVDKGALVSAAGDSVWAKSEGFEIKPEEIKEIVTGLAGNTDGLYSNGIHVAGVRYVLTNVGDEGKTLQCRKDKDGLIITKTVQAIIIAHYNETMLAGNTSTTVAKLAEYLISLGY